MFYDRCKISLFSPNYIMVLIMMIYSICAVIQEKQKAKYYKKTILYETNYDKYFTMVRKQKTVV